MTEFSLFEGDALNRFFNLFGIRSRGALNMAARFLFIFCVTFLPAALFCLIEGYGPGQPRVMNFFGDIGMYGQLFLGYPLFIIAEWVINEKTRATAKHFHQSGLVNGDDIAELDKLHEKIKRLRRSIVPDVVIILIAFVCAGFWLWEETHNTYDTWHAVGAPGVQWPTFAGWWVALFGIPVFNYWWLRWVWKVWLWCYYLRKVSKLDLRLIASHPDMTGGLAFLSETQGRFAIVIFAFGLGIIAPLLGYKLEIENADIYSFSLGGPLIGFVIGAPLAFTLPLLFFTKRLARTKRRAMDAYQDRSTEAALYFENKWLTACHDGECDTILSTNLSAMNNLRLAYEQIKKMRVVPFDMTSFSQLSGSTLGSLLPLLPKLIDLPDPVKNILELVKGFIK